MPEEIIDIHPFDFYELVSQGMGIFAGADAVSRLKDVATIRYKTIQVQAPTPYDIECPVIEYDGKTYCVTSTVAPKTRRII